MKRWTTPIVFGLVAGCCAWIGPSPASAQILGKLGKAGELAGKASELHITEAEEVELGRQISEKIRQRYGVVQSPEVHKYVTLVGAVLATSSTRPNLPWTFIVLDTDAVNAFAAPGGYVHITKGALAQIKNEAELAGVLGHELTHVTEKHTIAAIKKGKAADLAVSATGQGGGFTQEFIDKAKDAILQGFGQKEELEADSKGIILASKAGYSPTGLPEFLQALSDRNKNSTERKGLFASHPEMDERMKKLQDTITKNKLAGTAVLAERYKKVITFTPKALTEIATVQAGSAGLVGGGGAKKPDTQTAKNDDASKKEPEKKKGGFGLGKLGSFGGGEKKEAQVSGSGAARGVGNEDLAAKGGANPALVAVKITPADIEAFKKEGKLS